MSHAQPKSSPSVPPNCPPALNFLPLFLSPGFLLGWLCVSDQPHPHARAGPDGDWEVLSSHLRGILHCKNKPHIDSLVKQDPLWLECKTADVHYLECHLLSTQMYTLGTILSMQISFVGFQPVQSSEHMAVSQSCVFLA